MSVRNKLNQSYAHGCLLIAGIVGWISQSWLAFWVTFLILGALSIHGGDIRPQGRPPGRLRSRPPRFPPRP